MLNDLIINLPNQNKEKDKKAMSILIHDINQKPDSDKRTAIIEKARNLDYSDFNSKHPAPKLQLCNDLTNAGYTDLVKKMEDGDYDS